MKQFHTRFKQPILVFNVFLMALFFVSCNNQQDPKSDEPDVEMDTVKTEGSIVELKDSSDNAPMDRFKDAIEALEQITYRMVSYEELTPDKNFLNERIEYLNPYREKQNKPLIEKIGTAELLVVKRAKVKSTESMGDNLYPRATIEFWEFKNEQSALDSEKQVDYIKENYLWDRISKSPITYFRIKNELLFITPGGFYMLDKVDQLKASLIDKLELEVQ